VLAQLGWKVWSQFWRQVSQQRLCLGRLGLQSYLGKGLEVRIAEKPIDYEPLLFALGHALQVSERVQQIPFKLKLASF
jgi:hypothetical protein